MKKNRRKKKRGLDYSQAVAGWSSIKVVDVPGHGWVTFRLGTIWIWRKE